MTSTREFIPLIVGAVAAVILQLLLVPALAVGSILPNVIVVYVMLIAVIRASNPGYVMPFVLGLIFDFMSGGPIGPMAFTLVLVTFAASRLFVTIDNETHFIALFTLAIALLATEIIYGMFLLGLGYEAKVFDALLFRALPCTLYDCVCAGILYIPAVRLFGQTTPLASDITNVR